MAKKREHRTYLDKTGKIVDSNYDKLNYRGLNVNKGIYIRVNVKPTEEERILKTTKEI